MLPHFSLLDELLKEYMPQGHCYLWQPGLLWTHVISDFVIFFSYMIIPICMLYVYNKRKGEITYKNTYLLFTLFIFSCASTHLLEIITVWHGYYFLTAVFKFVTAVISLASAIALWSVSKTILKIPTIVEYKKIETMLKLAELRLAKIQNLIDD